MLVYGKCERFVIRCLCLVNFSILHDLPFVNAGRGFKKRPYGRGILRAGLPCR